MTIRQLQRITPPQPESKNWLIEHLKGNIISSLSILVMMFGLCTIYAYHFHIEYFPLIGIDSFTSIIFATTYVGTLLLLGFGTVLRNVSILLIAINATNVWHVSNVAELPLTNKCYHDWKPALN